MRNFSIGLLIIGVCFSGLFLYRTSLHGVDAVGEFGGVSLMVEYAITDTQKEKGLSGRESISSDYGMLFVFPKDDLYGFWMKDMLISIDVFWLDDKGHVVSMVESIAPSSYPNVFYPPTSARYVLETVSGFAHEHNIATGTPLLLKKFPIVSK